MKRKTYTTGSNACTFLFLVDRMYAYKNLWWLHFPNMLDKILKKKITKVEYGVMIQKILTIYCMEGVFEIFNAHTHMPDLVIKALGDLIRHTFKNILLRSNSTVRLNFIEHSYIEFVFTKFFVPSSIQLMWITESVMFRLTLKRERRGGGRQF
jgi:hypothetical protein